MCLTWKRLLSPSGSGLRPCSPYTTAPMMSARMTTPSVPNTAYARNALLCRRPYLYHLRKGFSHNQPACTLQEFCF